MTIPRSFNDILNNPKLDDSAIYKVCFECGDCKETSDEQTGATTDSIQWNDSKELKCKNLGEGNENRISITVYKRAKDDFMMSAIAEGFIEEADVKKIQSGELKKSVRVDLLDMEG